MAETAADFIDHLAKKQQVDDILAIFQTVIDGPHPESIKQAFKEYRDRLRP